MSNWDERWMGLAKHVANWSKDRSTKTSCVIVDDRQVLLSLGWNGFPRGVDDDPDSRHERPAKYKWTEHAERNAIYNAAAAGHALRGATMYLPWFPCADCARAIIQSGIQHLVAIEPDWNDERWQHDFAVAAQLLFEGGVEVSYYREGHGDPA